MQKNANSNQNNHPPHHIHIYLGFGVGSPLVKEANFVLLAELDHGTRRISVQNKIKSLLNYVPDCDKTEVILSHSILPHTSVSKIYHAIHKGTCHSMPSDT